MPSKSGSSGHSRTKLTSFRIGITASLSWCRRSRDGYRRRHFTWSWRLERRHRSQLLPRSRLNLERVRLFAGTHGSILKVLGHLDYEGVTVFVPLQILIPAQHANSRTLPGFNQRGFQRFSRPVEADHIDIFLILRPREAKTVSLVIAHIGAAGKNAFVVHFQPIANITDALHHLLRPLSLRIGTEADLKIAALGDDVDQAFQHPFPRLVAVVLLVGKTGAAGIDHLPRAFDPAGVFRDHSFRCLIIPVRFDTAIAQQDVGLKTARQLGYTIGVLLRLFGPTDV